MSPVTFVLIAVVTFVVMEPVTYLVHRYVMHGPGMAWHASHHAARRGRFERNDLFPVCFGVATFLVMLAGAVVPGLRALLPIGVGVMAYGAAYFVVHDVYAHRRVLRSRARVPGLERLARAHQLHHRHGGEPYGFLVPVTRETTKRVSARR